MKKALLIALALAAFFLEGCARNEKTNTIVVGWFGPLTGDQALWGENEFNAVRLIFDEYNLKGGIDIGGTKYRLEAVGYDNKGDPVESINVVKRLAGQDRVVAIIGPNSSDCAIATAPFAEKAKVPDIATAATNPAVTMRRGKVRPYEFRACYVDTYQGTVAAGFAYDVLKSRRAAILHDETNVYSKDLRDFFVSSYEKRGGQVVADESFKAGDVDFKPQLSKIKASNPDLIFMPNYSKDVATQATQARAIGLRQTFLGGDGWPSDQLLAMGGSALNGSYFVDHLNYSDPAALKFAAAYRAKYGKDTQLNGYLAHDATVLLLAAAQKAGKPTSQAIAQALNGITVEGITGELHVSPTTHNPEGVEATITEIKGGKYLLKQKYSAQ